jgi:S1-C subfamily serine protease
VDITSVLGTQNAEAQGTGMVLNSQGEVLTNNHVVEGGTKITAQVDGRGRVFNVKVLGVDPTQDVALVQMIGASGLAHVSLGDSSTVAVGDPVVAIGNALGLGGTPTVTSGSISALHRAITASDSGAAMPEHLKGLLQTDAPINRGDSGGPLVDANGDVIGMDTAAAEGTGNQGVSNVGFAIPINTAMAVARAIQQGNGSSTIFIGQRGILGVDVESVQQASNAVNPFFGGGSVNVPVKAGAYVVQVVSGSPAANAGIRPGDVVVALDGTAIKTPQGLSQALTGDHPGKKVTVAWVDGNGNRQSKSVNLMAGPPA